MTRHNGRHCPLSDDVNPNLPGSFFVGAMSSLVLKIKRSINCRSPSCSLTNWFFVCVSLSAIQLYMAIGAFVDVLCFVYGPLPCIYSINMLRSCTSSNTALDSSSNYGPLDVRDPQQNQPENVNIWRLLAIHEQDKYKYDTHWFIYRIISDNTTLVLFCNSTYINL